jgi:site-specific DNA-methyltransferase (adenine-specific)
VTVSPSNVNSLDQDFIRAREHLIRAYESIYDGYSLDRVLADPELGSALWGKCHEVGLPGTPKDWNHLLLRLRKAGKLLFPTLKRTEFSWADIDEFLFASEIAWSEMKGHGTLDDIFCDPDLAHKFDEIASNLAPGFTSLHYRWGALTLRKKSKTARVRSEFFTKLSLKEFNSSQQVRSWTNDEDISNSPGLYLIKNSRQRIKYVGSALDLQKRLARQFGGGRLDHWEKKRDAKFISFLRKPQGTDPIDLLSMQKRLIQLAKPTLNDLGPTAA